MQNIRSLEWDFVLPTGPMNSSNSPKEFLEYIQCSFCLTDPAGSVCLDRATEAQLPWEVHLQPVGH